MIFVGSLKWIDPVGFVSWRRRAIIISAAFRPCSSAGLDITVIAGVTISAKGKSSKPIIDIVSGNAILDSFSFLKAPIVMRLLQENTAVGGLASCKRSFMAM